MFGHDEGDDERRAAGIVSCRIAMLLVLLLLLLPSKQLCCCCVLGAGRDGREELHSHPQPSQTGKLLAGPRASLQADATVSACRRSAAAAAVPRGCFGILLRQSCVWIDTYPNPVSNHAF